MELIVILLLIILCILVTKSTSGYNECSIPKIIHQTAPRDESKWKGIWKHCQESWRRNFPDWEYRMWTDEDLDELIRTKYEWFYDTYSNYPKNINRFDAARYFILYEYGGIYADMDYQCLKNFEHLIPKCKASAAESPFDNETYHEKYQNALMASPPKHPFWERIWEDLIKNKSNASDVISYTGPGVIIRNAEAYPELFQGLPKENFAQKHDDVFRHYRDAESKEVFTLVAPDEVYARHYGTSAWN